MNLNFLFVFLSENHFLPTFFPFFPPNHLFPSLAHLAFPLYSPSLFQVDHTCHLFFLFLSFLLHTLVRHGCFASSSTAAYFFSVLHASMRNASPYFRHLHFLLLSPSFRTRSRRNPQRPPQISRARSTPSMPLRPYKWEHLAPLSSLIPSPKTPPLSLPPHWIQAFVAAGRAPLFRRLHRRQWVSSDTIYTASFASQRSTSCSHSPHRIIARTLSLPSTTTRHRRCPRRRPIIHV